MRSMVRGPGWRRSEWVCLLACLLLAGCASPGPPRPPSLNLPGNISDLTALRMGDAVELRFTVPQRNTDHLPLRGDTVTAVLCRGPEGAPCVPLPGRQVIARVTAGHPTQAVLRDGLPPEWTSGGARALVYRVELFNGSGKTAGFSMPAFTLAGTAPLPVSGLRLEGSRLGVIVRWNAVSPDASVVAVRREALAPLSKTTTAAPKARVKTVLPVAKTAGEGADVVWLSADGSASASAMLDTTAAPGEPYRYSAERRRTVTLGGRTIEMRSELSPGPTFVLHDTFPPPVPTDMSAAAFTVDGVLSVDLIWQPVEDAGLQGYIVYRSTLGAGGVAGRRVRLTPQPVGLPAFHDKGVAPGQYRYQVTAVDVKGNESAAAQADVTME